LNIPNVGKILPISRNGTRRDTGVNDLIKLIVNAWRVNTNDRVINVSDILQWAKGNGEVRRKVPKCP